jgi:hypothetical protein
MVFWSLPLLLLFSVRTALSDWFRPMGFLPAFLSALLLCAGLWQLGWFQAQERIWTTTLERAKLLAVAVAGLTPFVHWWNQAPNISFFGQMTLLLLFLAIALLFSLNHVLLRLTAMLPDETLRQETAFFSGINRILLVVLAVLLASTFLLAHLRSPILTLIPQLGISLRTYLWVFLSMILLPLALTMTLIWKTKEVILAGVFSPPPS